MPRIMHWLQQHNVAFYPSNCMRQNHQNMGAEYLIMQFQALCGGDRFANFPHWLAWAGSILAASLIARILGARSRGQVLAALFAATGPMAVLQSTSTQSDMLSSFWTIVFIYFAIRWLVIDRKMSPMHFFFIGASLGLATITKSTIYPVAPPFLLWLAIGIFAFLRGKWWKPAVLITVVFLAMNLPTYVRNYQLYEHPLGPRTEGGGPAPVGEYGYTNPVMTPAIFASNYVRNLALHATIFPINNPELQLLNFAGADKVSPLKKIQDGLQNGIRKWCVSIGVNPDDSKFAFAACPFAIPPVIFNDENDGDPLHMMLLLILSPIFLVATLVFVLRPQLRHRMPWHMLLLWLAAQGSFMLFCAILRWQPWHSRLHIVFFLMFAPFVGFVLDWLPKSRGMRWPLLALGNIAAALLLAGGFLWATHNMQRGFQGGGDITKRSREDLQVMCASADSAPFREMAKFLKDKGIRNVAMVQCGEPMEYCYWLFLTRYMGAGYRMQDIFVNVPPSVPDAFIAAIEKTDPRETARLKRLNEYLPRVRANYKKLSEKPEYADFKPDVIIHSKVSGPGYLPLEPDGTAKYQERVFRLVWTSDKHDVYLPMEKVAKDQKPVQFGPPATTTAQSPGASAVTATPEPTPEPGS